MIKLLTHLKHRDFARLWLAQLISQFGDRIHQLALIGLIAQRAPGSAMGLAKLLAFTIIPVFIVQPFAGVFVDRLDRRTTLFICDCVRGILVLTIPFVFIYQESMVPIYLIVFLVFCFSRFYVPAKLSIIPDLVHEDYLLEANSLITTTGMIAAGLGAVLGAFLIEYYGPRNGFIIDAATFFFSAIFLFNINLPWKIKLYKDKILEKKKDLAKEIKKSIFEEMKEGLNYLLAHKDIRLILNLLFLTFGAAGAIYVVMIVFIQGTFNSVTKDLGILAVALVSGLFIGVLGYGKWGKNVRWDKAIYFCFIFAGAMLIVFASVTFRFANLWMAMLLSFSLGLTIGPIFVAANTIVQLISNEEMRGKVFSALEIIIHLSFLITMFLTSWLSEFVESVWILVVVGVICSLVGVVGFIGPPSRLFGKK